MLSLNSIFFVPTSSLASLPQTIPRASIKICNRLSIFRSTKHSQKCLCSVRHNHWRVFRSSVPKIQCAKATIYIFRMCLCVLILLGSRPRLFFFIVYSMLLTGTQMKNKNAIDDCVYICFWLGSVFSLSLFLRINVVKSLDRHTQVTYTLIHIISIEAKSPVFFPSPLCLLVWCICAGYIRSNSIRNERAPMWHNKKLCLWSVLNENDSFSYSPTQTLGSGNNSSSHCLLLAAWSSVTLSC